MLRSRARTFVVLLAATLLGPAGVVAVAPQAALGAGCSVAVGAKTYPSLATAIAKAPAGATLTVSGTCRGAFTIGKKLTLKSGSPAGILKGSTGTVLTANGGPLKVIGLTITGGKATTCASNNVAVCGGGLYVASGVTVSLTKVRMLGNVAVGTKARPDAHGGAIENEGTLSIVASTISGNSVTSTNVAEGGGISVFTGSLSILRSLISSNHATGTAFAGGGAIVNNDGSVSVIDSTLSENSASSVSISLGGAYVDGKVAVTPSLRISGSTVTLNDGGATGVGGVGSVGDVRIDSTILADNVGSPRDCLLGGTQSLNLSYDLVGTNTNCFAFTDGVNGNVVGSDAAPVNPRLDELASNGGPTKTHRLQSNSPAIGAAGAAPCLTPADQRGVKRPQGAACDIGAYER
ncbi:MAG: choice-of-anchor Q domain-containing protein [Chloroflexota bacterium]